MKKAFLLLVSAFLASLSVQAMSQDYPSRSITMIVPFPPGAGLDPVSRTLAPIMSKELGQSVIVENKAGASGIIGVEAVRNSPADGYTILFASYQQFTALPQTRKTPYKREDFIPVGSVGRAPVMVVARSGLPFNDVRGMVQYAKQNPGKLRVATSGPQSASDIDGKIIAKLTGIDVVFVPYQGAGPSIVALLSGEVDIVIAAPVAARQHVAAGTLKWLGAQSRERFEYLPDVPTLEEQGVSIVDESRFLLLVPKNTPDAVIAKLDAAFAKAAASDMVKELLKKSMISESNANRSKTAAELTTEFQYWTKQLDIVGMRQ
jgi:tripartite-type tricarboxylate transporter receptor subunit TctC